MTEIPLKRGVNKKRETNKQTKQTIEMLIKLFIEESKIYFTCNKIVKF